VPPMPKKEVDGDGIGSRRREEVTIGLVTKVGKKNTHVLATARNKSKRKARTALGMAICLEHQRVLNGGMPRFEWRGASFFSVSLCSFYSLFSSCNVRRLTADPHCGPPCPLLAFLSLSVR
jgi:hypothetical protein